jgi:hypothetical protein
MRRSVVVSTLGITQTLARGDKSGTDALEKRLWKAAGLDPVAGGSWYRDIGGGMGVAGDLIRRQIGPEEMGDEDPGEQRHRERLDEPVDADGRGNAAPVSSHLPQRVRGMKLTARAASPADAHAIAVIYNEGIADRIGTFETEPRGADQIAAWFDGRHPIIVVVLMIGEP